MQINNVHGKDNPWVWVQMARSIRTKTPTQHHILLMLSQYANKEGVCWPSIDQLMEDTGYGSRSTIAAALRYLRDELKVITWKPGHGNQYKALANTYQFIFGAMVALLKAQKAEQKSESC